jgi:acyl-Coa thioesterase superfamily protein/acyl-CoA thioesterase superfamily protein
MPGPEDASFDTATSIQPTADPEVFTAEVHPMWTVGDKPNGGYLLALLGRAARTVAQRDGGASWEVQSASVTYLHPPELGPASVHTTLMRRGRSASHVRTVLAQGGTDLVDAVCIVSDIPAEPATRYDAVAPLRAPEPQRCVRLPAEGPGRVRVGFADAVELRLDPAALPFYEAPPPEGTPAELRGWTRFADGRAPDPLSLLLSLDAIPPATLVIGSSGWVPTLQMSTYVRARPAPGWLGIRIAANLVADGVVDESCVLWDSRGRVVAQATQLARLRFPDDPG